MNLRGLFLLAALALPACRDDRPHDRAPVSVAPPSVSARPHVSAASMRVVTGAIEADPTVDARAIRSTLNDAETPLVDCLGDQAASGAIALSFAIERDGAVGELVEGARTTYRDDDVRACVARLVKALRFPSAPGTRASVALVLEIRPRRDGGE